MSATAGDAANLGLARPPLIYLTSILTGWALEAWLPWPFLPAALAMPLGLGVILLAVALFVWAVRTFRAAGTPVPGNEPTTVIVRRGPYRVSRNPIYVAFTALQAGLACWVNGLWLLGTLIPAVAVVAGLVVPREERYLEGKFGADYASYRASTRRWL